VANVKTRVEIKSFGMSTFLMKSKTGSLARCQAPVERALFPYIIVDTYLYNKLTIKLTFTII